MPDELDGLLSTLKPRDDLDSLIAGLKSAPVDVPAGLPLPGIPKPNVEMREQGVLETIASVPKQAYGAWEQDYKARIAQAGGHPASRPLAPLTKVPFMPTPVPGGGVDFQSVADLRANNPKDIPTAVASGAVSTVEGLTSPEMVAVVGGMMAAPPIVAAIANGYFTAEMLKGMVQQSPELSKAAQEGRWADAAEIATQLAATTAFAGHAGSKAVKDVGAGIKAMRPGTRPPAKVPVIGGGEPIVESPATMALDDAILREIKKITKGEDAPAIRTQPEPSGPVETRPVEPAPAAESPFSWNGRRPIPRPAEPAEGPTPVTAPIVSTPEGRKGVIQSSPAVSPRAPQLTEKEVPLGEVKTEAQAPETPGLLKPAVPQARPIVPNAGERGAIGGSAPKSDADLYVEMKVAKREAARKSGRPGLVSVLRDFYRDAKNKTVDFAAYAEDAFDAAQKKGSPGVAYLPGKWKYQIRPTIERANPRTGATERVINDFGYQVDRVLRNKDIAGEWMKADPNTDVQFIGKGLGFEKFVQDVPDLNKFDQYMLALHTRDVESRFSRIGPQRAQRAADARAAADAAKQAGSPDAAALERAARRAEEIAKEKLKDRYETGRTSELVNGKQYSDSDLIRDLAPEYEPHAQRFREIDGKLMDYLVDTGIISKELKASLQELYPNYVPLLRVFSELERPDNVFATSGGVAGLSKQRVIEKLSEEGSEREIEHSVGSFLLKIYRAVEQGEKNRAAQIIKNQEGLPGFEEIINPPKRFRSAATAEIPYYENGRRTTLRTTPEIARAIKKLEVQNLGRVFDVLKAFNRNFKRWTTGINPAFAAANPARDQIQAFINSQHPLYTSAMNAKLFVQSLADVATHDKMYHEMVSVGGGGSSWDLVREKPMLTVEEMRAGKTPGTWLAYRSDPRRQIENLESVSARSEEFTRMMQYHGTKEHALKREGRLPEDAVIMGAKAAQWNTSNFSRGGEWRQALNLLQPYLPASIQGSRSFVRALSDRPGHTLSRLAIGVGIPVAATTIYNLMDPERAKKYKDIRTHEKEHSLFLIPPDVKQDERGRYVLEYEVPGTGISIPTKIPLPPGTSDFAIPLRREIEALYGGDPLKFREVAAALFSAVSPIEPSVSGTASNFAIQAFKPSLEVAINKDTFRNMEIEDETMRGRPVELRYHPWTSATARIVGKPFGVGGAKTEHWLAGMGGGATRNLLNLSDKVLAATGAIPWSEVGGSSVSESVGARFTRAAGGQDRTTQIEKQGELREQLRDAGKRGDTATINRIVKELQGLGMERREAERAGKTAQMSDAEQMIQSMPVREAVTQFQKLSPPDQAKARPILQKRIKAAKYLPPYLIQQVRSMGFTVK